MPEGSVVRLSPRYAVALVVAAVLMPSTRLNAAVPGEGAVDVLHGVTVRDPYRGLENVRDPAVLAWLKEQGDAARKSLDGIALRDALERRIAELSSATGDVIGGVTRMPGGQVYYLKRERNGRQFKLVMRERLGAAERVLVDPESESKRTGVPHAINYFTPSWNGRYIAYGMSAGGSEDASLYVLEVKSGKTIGASVPRVREAGVSWLPDGVSLAFNQLKQLKPGEPDSETYMDSVVLVLKVGAPTGKAKPVFGPTVTKDLGLGRLDVGRLIFAPGSPWVIARTTDTTLPEGFLFVAPVVDLDRPAVAWKRIATYADRIIDVELQGNDLYLLSRAEAPRRRVLKLDLRKPVLATATEVAVPPRDGVLEEIMLTRDALIASVRQGTSIVLRRYAPGDRAGKAVLLPFPGAAQVHGDPAHAHRDVLYTLSGWTDLPRTFRLANGKSTDAGLRVPVVMPNLPDVEVREVRAPSHDGVLVPVTLLHRKGLARDGNNPTLLYGYGSYGFSYTAGFRPTVMAWIEQGGVVALANVRGSGVYGDEWYRAGFKATKSNTWKDGIAAARYLIAEGYASPKMLAVTGGSAGGIFAGRALTAAPELFAAAVIEVGVLDAVRAEESANGITNISEFGSAKNPVEFPALLEMSTYHAIRDGTAYPAILLVHGMNDPRVDVWHSAKAAARFQAATANGKPVLLRLDMQAGHGIGSTATQRYAVAADTYAFLLWQMGKAGPKGN